MVGSFEANSRHLSVIGAGPKAVALAAKHFVLQKNKMPVPELEVFDHNGLAAHWNGRHGYTDGRLALGTPPEKDVGFPYATNEFDPTDNRLINTEMLEYSWATFNVQDDRRSYAEWVDRGRPNPQHAHWAEYLEWVAERIELEIRNEELSEIGIAEDRWRLRFASGLEQCTDALIISGPGRAHANIELQGQSEQVVNGQSFWRDKARSLLHTWADRQGRACVIGSGETAAAIVAHLITQLPRFAIDIVSKEGIIYTRGESYEENRLFSDPGGWLEFPSEVRRKFVTRTDRGVFSVANKATINKSYAVRTITGTVETIEAVDDGKLRLNLKDEPPEGDYDLIVDATGFCTEWFVEIMDDEARAAFEAVLLHEDPEDEQTLPERISLVIDHDLALIGLTPRIHLPMFAGFGQGPGFPNLGCLGTLSDRILRPHCQAAAAPVLA